MRTPSRIAGALALFVSASLLASLPFFVGCNSSSNNSGGSPTVFSGMAVADLMNNRVLLFHSPLSTGQSAGIVLGQAGFDTATTGSTASTMSHPAGAVTDSAGNLYVADGPNCRLLQFAPPFATGMNASIAFGQSSLTTGTCSASATANTLGGSTYPFGIFGVTFDSQGDLWVVDSGSNRVVEFVPPFSSGMAATLAIGQPNLTSNGHSTPPTPSAANLYDPVSAAFDGSGNLWLCDFTNNRVLEFTAPFSTGMAASKVLGQSSFTSGLPHGSAANTLTGPSGIAFDSSGDLWVADAGSNRVLEFVPPLATDMSASLVLGQVDLVHGSSNQGNPAPSAATTSFPRSLAFDSSGALYIADAGNNRVLLFTPPFSTGMSASAVIGQSGFTTATAATTAAGMTEPTGIALAGMLK